MMLAPDADLDLLLSELEAREAAGVAQWGTPFTPVLPEVLRKHVHVQKLADVLDRVKSGEIRRLMVLMPPRHLKSTTVSRWFVASWLKDMPHDRMVLASYALKLAQAHSRAAQELFVQMGGVLASGQAEKSEWDTADGGGLLAVGIGSGLTGYGARVLILDDSVKDAEEAASEAIAQRNRDWYDSTFRTRAQGDDVQIIIETLWPGKASLAGYALEQEGGDFPERWTILALDALRDATPYEFPKTCTVLPDWRQPGEALCPAIKTVDQLRAMRSKSGFFFGALYQQRPKARDGVFFKWDDFVVVDAAPVVSDLVAIVRYWDMAGTELRDTNDPDATSGVLMAKHKDGTFWVLDRARIVAAVAKRDAFIRQTADADRARWGTKPVQWFEKQAGIGGHDAMQSLARLLSGHHIQSEPATGSKELRADPYSGQVQAKNVRLVKAAWNDGYRLELCAFPFGAHDDDVDASSGAFSKCADVSTTVRVVQVSYA